MPVSKKRVVKPSRRRTRTPREVQKCAEELFDGLTAMEAGIPVWLFPQQAFELSLRPPPAHADPMSAEEWLDMLAFMQIRTRCLDEAEPTTSCVAQLADESGRTVGEVVAEFIYAHEAGQVTWDDEGEVHVFHVTSEYVAQAVSERSAFATPAELTAWHSSVPRVTGGGYGLQPDGFVHVPEGPDTTALAEMIKRERVEKGWSQTDLARRCGLSPSTVGEIERQRNPLPSPETLDKLDRGLGWGADTCDTVLRGGVPGEVVSAAADRGKLRFVVSR
ncbi:helix-turn-helix domain-containing protein [Nocardia sp. 2YAB30]|uniref:helix-turn-helix domain-containing protein n=1 Tax=Nocardia sp. 2YAB30 TaxID=3233022 RepID=UPI003F9E8BDA